jgi:hypothetical protein
LSTMTSGLSRSSRRCAQRPRRWLAATRRLICSYGGGSRQSTATVAWC